MAQVWPFARSLAAALERRGQHVAVDPAPARARWSRSLDDVVLVLRGLDAVVPQPGPLQVLWVISHPDQVTAEEAGRYALVFASSASWARDRSAAWGLPVAPLLQCTDAEVFHPLAIEDAAHGHTRSKLEMFGDDLFMVISTVSYVEHDELTDTSEVVATGQVMVFLGEHFVITVRRGEHAQLSSLRRTMEADPTRMARGPSEVLYAIADKIIDDYLEVVAEFEKDVDEIETLVFARHGQREVERVYQLKRELIEFKRSVMPLGAPLLRLATRELPVIPPEAKAYFRELADHHTEAREAVAAFDEVLTSILQAGLARASVADNEDMRKISGWVAIVVVPTLVAGIYGMNFDNMPELHWRYGYFVVIGAMLSIMIALYLGFKRNKWL